MRNGRVGHIYIKGVTGRFGFDDSRISQVQTVSQKQSNGNAPRVFYMYSPWCTLLYRKGKGELYTDIGVGLSALLVSTNWAMREPLNRGTSDRLAPRFLCVYGFTFCFSLQYWSRLEFKC